MEILRKIYIKIKIKLRYKLNPIYLDFLKIKICIVESFYWNEFYLGVSLSLSSWWNSELFEVMNNLNSLSVISWLLTIFVAISSRGAWKVIVDQLSIRWIRWIRQSLISPRFRLLQLVAHHVILLYHPAEMVPLY